MHYSNTKYAYAFMHTLFALAVSSLLQPHQKNTCIGSYYTINLTK